MLEARFYGEKLSNYLQAGSQSCSPSVLEQLAHSDVDRIRLRVAENPNTPIDVLELLSTDSNADVRVAVGTNPSTPPHMSYTLAFDMDPNVRLGLAEDLNTPIGLLDKLIEDENPYVSFKASETKALIVSKDKPREFGCHRFFRWAAKGADQPELRYA